MAEVIVYTKNWCPFCDRAKDLLKRLGQSYKEINVEDEEDGFDKLKAKTGMMTVPQIFINEELIGGFQELSGLQASGELSKLLES